MVDVTRSDKIKLCDEVRTELWKLRDELAELRKIGCEDRDPPYYLKNGCTDVKLLEYMQRDVEEIKQLRDLIEKEKSSFLDIGEFQKLHTSVFGELKTYMEN